MSNNEDDNKYYLSVATVSILTLLVSAGTIYLLVIIFN